MEEYENVNYVTHQEFLKKRKLEKRENWKKNYEKSKKNQLFSNWNACNESTKLFFLHEILYPQKGGQNLFKLFKEDDEDFSRYEILMNQLSRIYASQQTLTHTDLLALLAPLWTHPELKQKGFRISSHTFAEARRKKEKEKEKNLREESDEENENFQNEFFQEEESGNQNVETSISNLDLSIFNLPPKKKKLVYLEPGTRVIPKGTAFHHF